MQYLKQLFETIMQFVLPITCTALRVNIQDQLHEIDKLHDWVKSSADTVDLQYNRLRTVIDSKASNNTDRR